MNRHITKEEWARVVRPYVRGYGEEMDINALVLADRIVDVLKDSGIDLREKQKLVDDMLSDGPAGELRLLHMAKRAYAENKERCLADVEMYFRDKPEVKARVLKELVDAPKTI